MKNNGVIDELARGPRQRSDEIQGRRRSDEKMFDIRGDSGTAVLKDCTNRSFLNRTLLCHFVQACNPSKPRFHSLAIDHPFDNHSPCEPTLPQQRRTMKSPSSYLYDTSLYASFLETPTARQQSCKVLTWSIATCPTHLPNTEVASVQTCSEPKTRMVWGVRSSPGSMMVQPRESWTSCTSWQQPLVNANKEF